MASSIGFRNLSFLPSLLFKLRGLNFYPGGSLTHCSCQPSLDAHFSLLIERNGCVRERAACPYGLPNSRKALFSSTESTFETVRHPGTARDNQSEGRMSGDCTQAPRCSPNWPRYSTFVAATLAAPFPPRGSTPQAGRNAPRNVRSSRRRDPAFHQVTFRVDRIPQERTHS
jgi:hypothetical protein